MTGRCGTCKWWGQFRTTNERADQFTKNFGSCKNGKFHYTFTFPDEYELKQTKDEKDVVFVEDDEGWGALFGADFGCVHWEDQVDFSEENPEPFVLSTEIAKNLSCVACSGRVEVQITSKPMSINTIYAFVGVPYTEPVDPILYQVRCIEPDCPTGGAWREGHF